MIQIIAGLVGGVALILVICFLLAVALTALPYAAVGFLLWRILVMIGRSHEQHPGAGESNRSVDDLPSGQEVLH